MIANEKVEEIAERANVRVLTSELHEHELIETMPVERKVWGKKTLEK